VSAAPLKVLIVDDEEDIRFVIRMLIEGADLGLTVAGEAPDGPTAIAQAKELQPDVIVLDQQMPGMSGTDAAGRIGENVAATMILCSAYLDDDVRRRAEDAGITVCLTKHEVKEIPRIIRSLVGG